MSVQTAPRPVPWWVLGFCVAVCLTGIFDRDLWTPDEPRDAAVSLAMVRSGDYVVPHLAGEPFVEKPPLYFAVAGVFAGVFGPVVGTTGAIRFSTALWGIGALTATYLLARRMFGRDVARLAVAVLATMGGFVENLHWIRVDAALLFFVCAAAWSLGEVYLGDRAWFCLALGAFAGGAFLTKGVIGPALIGTAWLGAVIPWWRARHRAKAPLFAAQHVLGVLVFALPACWWMILFKARGGPELWHQWFYENHFGRLAGTATELGHVRTNPFYYVQATAYYTLPWLPALGLAFAAAIRDLRHRRVVTSARAFLLVWSVGSVLLLSCSQTKREIYLLPVLPAFAILCATELMAEPPRWAVIFWKIWMGLCVLVLAASCVSPVWAALLPASTPEAVRAVLGAFGWRHAVTGAALAGAVVLSRRSAVLSGAAQVAAVTALLAIGLFSVPAQVVDAAKNLKGGTEAFVAAIPPDRRPRVAGLNLSETDRALLDYYAGWAVPTVSKSRLDAIAQGTDREYDSVITHDRQSVLDAAAVTPLRVLAEAALGESNARRKLYWIGGGAPRAPAAGGTARRGEAAAPAGN